MSRSVDWKVNTDNVKMNGSQVVHSLKTKASQFVFKIMENIFNTIVKNRMSTLQIHGVEILDTVQINIIKLSWIYINAQ